MGKEEKTWSTSEFLSELRKVEDSKPGLTEASREHSERPAVALRANLTQTLECFELNGVRRWR